MARMKQELPKNLTFWCPTDHAKEFEEGKAPDHSARLKIVDADNGDVETWYELECPVCKHKALVEVHGTQEEHDAV